MPYVHLNPNETATLLDAVGRLKDEPHLNTEERARLQTLEEKLNSVGVEGEHHAKIRKLAQDRNYEVDDDAIVSEGDDNGAYVHAWVWVDFEGTDLDKDKSYRWGDLEDGSALTIDVYHGTDKPYYARAWYNGNTTALEYFASFQECIDYFKSLPPDQEHDKPGSNALAPQIGGRWVLVGPWETEESWWPEGRPADMPTFIYLDDLKEI